MGSSVSISEKSLFWTGQDAGSRFYERMVERLPVLLERFKANPRTILDLSCGDGTFAILLARQGFKVTGVDTSPWSLEYARSRAREEGLSIGFLLQDLRSLSSEFRFDLATCWFDNLNALLDGEELYKVFCNVQDVVQPGGLFLFEMNTIYGLAVHWQWNQCYVHQESAEHFELHRPTYDYERNIATLRVTRFQCKGELWQRAEEIVQERGYTLEELRQVIREAGWEELACFGDPWKMTPPNVHSARVWFALQAPPEGTVRRREASIS
ncbi:MAG: class I SAM-dependent methyltransferase [Coprothermobacterota bacterium]|nr:class I SAM-dependent methyltransferase [Coprothermobacterota bacterium]